MICRILVSATSESPYIISLIKLFHAIEVPLFVISVFKYSVSNFDSRLSSTIFLVGFQIASSLGIVLLSIPVGMLFDAFGYHFVFWIGPYISIHFLSLNPLLVRRRRYSRGERYPSALCGCHSL